MTAFNCDGDQQGIHQHASRIQDATGAPDEELVLGLQEVPSSQAMEMGKIMPDVTS
jgi:hypothetical protein